LEDHDDDVIINLQNGHQESSHHKSDTTNRVNGLVNVCGTKPKQLPTCSDSSSQIIVSDSSTIKEALRPPEDQLQKLSLTEAEQLSLSCAETDVVTYSIYENELQMPDIMRLIQKDLSEPYSIYTYRYFIHNWPHLCFMARVNGECVGAIVCKLDYHKKVVKRGYIAMLAVDSGHRKRKIGSTLVKRAIDAMIAEDADEVVLETEITDKPALRLYENLGFVRDKRLFRYYLNGVDALRLKLWLR